MYVSIASNFALLCFMNWNGGLKIHVSLTSSFINYNLMSEECIINFIYLITIHFLKVAGRHLPMFEIYYLSLDPTGKGQVQALDAAKFLKRSGLTDAILSKVRNLQYLTFAPIRIRND